MELVNLTKLKVSCKSCGLAELCLPHGISNEDLESLDSMVRHTKPLAKGGYLFRAGDALDALYLVRSGSVKILMDSDGGDEQIQGFFLPGELLGFDALGSGKHTCTAKALETASICTLPYQELTKICLHVPALHGSLMRLIGREISTEQELLMNINRRQAHERVAAFLLSLSHRFQRLGYSPKEFRLTMTRGELGNYLGLTIETVSRAMSSLQKEKVLAVKQRLIRVLNLEALHAICHGHQSGAPARQRARG